MTTETPDDSPDVRAAPDVTESELARLVGRHVAGDDSVSEDELRSQLQQATHGTVVALNAGEHEFTVLVERGSGPTGEPVREWYAIRRMTGLEGEPPHWSYLGPET